MKTKNKLLEGILIGVFLLATNILVAQTNTSPVQTVCAGSMAEPYLINPPTAGSTYQWSVSGGGVLNNGVTSDNITIDWGMTPGTYTVSVVETDVNGCSGAPVTVDVTVLPLPSLTTVNSQIACVGGVVPDLFAVGSSPNWYTDIALTNNVFTGNSFSTGQTSVGVYTYYVTETLNGCEGAAVPVTLEIYSVPSAPVATNEAVCEGGVIPDLIATGNSLVWYSDALLTNVVGNGSAFNTGQTNSGVYTYYVAQSNVNGCESAATIVNLEIYALPSSPVATNESACFGTTIPPLSTTGTPFTTWYDDSGLSNVVQSGGNSYLTGQTTVGVYTYYITDTDVNGCESPGTPVTLEIFALPSAPTANNEVVCEGGVIPDLTATGTSVIWYSDVALTAVLGNGSSFATGQSNTGVYTYYVTQNDGNGCQSSATTVTLEIYSLPTSPVSTNEIGCEGGFIPDLTATGNSVVWYSDASLTTVVSNGSLFATGQTNSGVYTYYVTQSNINGCESAATAVTLTISPFVSAPLVFSQTACFGSLIPDLTATGNSLVWYSDASLNTVVGNGSPFSTGQTNSGVYTYYVTQNIGSGCESAASIITLEIYSLPTTGPINHW